MGVRRRAFAVAAAVSAAAAALGPADAAVQCGKAAWFDLTGLTASGERADPSSMTAAHPSLPFGTKVRVENLATGRSAVVRVNDRGPFGRGGRVIDVSRAAAEELGMIRSGIASVRVTVLDGRSGALPGACDGAPSPSEPRIVEARADPAAPVPRLRPGAAPVSLPRIEPATAAHPPAPPPAVIVDPDAPMVLVPQTDTAALPLRFRDAFAPSPDLLTLTESLRNKAESAAAYAPVDPHHNVAPREPWDYLQQGPE